MPATRTCPEGTDEIELGIPNTWIIAPEDYGRTGWLLTGSYQASAETPLGMTSISETWEFPPIFDDA